MDSITNWLTMRLLLFATTFLLLLAMSTANTINGQVLQPQQQYSQPLVVSQQIPEVTHDRTSVSYKAPAATYDYTYLTKPYGYSAFRNYDTNQLQPESYNTAYSAGVSNYGGFSGLISSIWPLILLPFLIFVGLSIFFPLVVQYPNQWGSRESNSEPTDEASFILQSVLHAVENNKCLEKTACDLGLYARHLGSSKVTVLGFVEKFAPSSVLPYMEIMRKAANHKGDTKDVCDRYNCEISKSNESTQRKR